MSDELKLALEVLSRHLLNASSTAAPARELTVSDVLQRYWDAEGKFLKGAKQNQSRLVTLKKHFASVAAAEIDSSMVGKFREIRAKQKTRKGTPPLPGSRNREVSLLQRSYAWACEQRPPLITSNPITKLLKEPENNIRQGNFHRDEILASLLAKSGPILRALILVLLDCGLRKQEAVNLRWSQFDPVTGWFVVTETKNGQPRRPRLSRRALAAVAELPRVCDHVFANPKTGRRYSVEHLGCLFNDAVEASGVPWPNGKRPRIHDLRHAFAYSALVKWGWSQRTTKNAGGWKTDSAFERYGLIDAAAMQNAYDARDEVLAALEAGRRGPRTVTPSGRDDDSKTGTE